MRSRLSDSVRSLVAKRAQYICEYCHYPERLSFASFQLEHIRPLKHGGTDDTKNLAYACPPCNRAKGSNIGTFLEQDEVFTRLFHPRRDDWSIHFSQYEGHIEGKTDVGRATIAVLNLNELDRLIERQKAAALGY